MLATANYRRGAFTADEFRGKAGSILPGLTRYNIFSSPLLAAVTLAFLDDQPG